MNDKYKLLVLGCITGIISASLGIGGGAVIVPGLVLVFGYRIKKIIGTSLATIVPLTLVGVISHAVFNADNIKVLQALWVIITTIIGAYIGTKIVVRISSRNLKKAFAVFIFLIGLKLIGVVSFPANASTITLSYYFYPVIGFTAGIISSLFGIGGGTILVPSFYLLFGFTFHEAVATSLLVIVPTAAVGAYFHGKLQLMDKSILKILIPSALIGAVIGALAANKLPDQTLKIIFGCYLFFASMRMFLAKNGNKK